MKKLLTLIIFVLPFLISAQIGYNSDEKLTYKSDGKYEYVGYNNLSMAAKNYAKNYFIKFAKNNDLNYKILDQKNDVELDPNGVFANSTRYKYTAVVEFRDKSGNLFLSKVESKSLRKDAVEKLKELKELLEMGVIDQSEFDSAAEPLKKIILNN
tara:strand:+ start:8156 stop:8620 length:465 start_codon:yes stop_codon:yes gene_type:complete